MIKSLYQIETDIYNAAKAFFDGEVTGEVYREGCRPGNSPYEDVVCIAEFATTEQIQRGQVEVDIFVNDLDGYNRRMKDKKRLGELSDMGESFIEFLNDRYLSEYLFALKSSPGTRVLPNANQHYVLYEIEFQRQTF